MMFVLCIQTEFNVKKQTKKQRVIGIDPGYGRIGYGIIEGSSTDWKLVDYGLIETNAKKTLVDRLLDLEKLLLQIIKKYKPTIAGVEELFFHKNVKTALPVVHARGVILLTLQKNGLNIFEFKPQEIKQAMTGNGRAEKKQVQFMVQQILGLHKKLVQDDAVDALAVALTCSQQLRMTEYL